MKNNVLNWSSIIGAFGTIALLFLTPTGLALLKAEYEGAVANEYADAEAAPILLMFILVIFGALILRVIAWFSIKLYERAQNNELILWH
jgi:hypothetical protein